MRSAFGRSRRLLLVGLVVAASLSLAAPCAGPVFHEVDLGHGLTLTYWQVAERRISRTVFAYEFEASLSSASGTATETLVAVTGISGLTPVADASLRFPPVDSGASSRSLDVFAIRHDRDRNRQFSPSSLRFRALDRFGGDLAIASMATGRFRTEEIDGRHWLITPGGHAFFSSGLNHITFHGDYSPPIDRRPYHEAVLAKYGSEEAWAAATEDRMRSWNVNTVGAWSNDHDFPTMPYTPILSLHTAAPAVPDWPTGQTGKAIRDFFDPAFEANIASKAQRARDCARDPACIGVFSDNEMPLGVSVIQRGTYVDAYLTLPAGAPGKRELQAFFEQRYGGDIGAMNAAWSMSLTSFDDIQQLTSVEEDSEFCNADGRRTDRQAFVARVASRYFEVVDATLESISPGLLNLGARFLAVYTAPSIYEAAAPFVDVISINDYDWDQDGRGLFKAEGEPYGYLFLEDPVSDLQTVHELTGKPMMITEWTVRTPTPDVEVLFPPFMPTADTQEERADRYEDFMNALLERPYMVGAHWFKFHDQPATGRGDGENSRFGVVDINDDAYAVLSERMGAVNARLYTTPIAAAAAGGGAAEEASTAEPLGLRTFSIAAPQKERTGFRVFILPGANLAREVSGGPLLLEAGALDEFGVADLRLVEDAVIAIKASTADVACLKLRAEGSHGELACDGGFAHDVDVSLPTGSVGETDTPTTEVFLGEDAGPGAATLRIPMQFVQLPSGSAIEDCLTTSEYGAEHLAAFTTATVTSTKGETTFDTTGEAFHCGFNGASWPIEDGLGMLVVGVPLHDGRVPGGDLAAAFLLADREASCRP